jgi:hypothetical protein
MNNWSFIEQDYQKIIKNSISLANEWAWLDNTYNSLKKDTDDSWNELPDNEKRIKRIIWNKIMSKSVPNIEFGEAIIDLYESIFYVLNKIESIKFVNTQIIRLKAHIYLEQCNINAQKDIKQIKNLYYEEIKSVIYDCRNSHIDTFFIWELNILYLERKLEMAHKKHLEIKSY